METKLKVQGMTCEMCVKHVTSALQSVDGVKKAEVDLHAGQARVEHENAAPGALIDAVQEEGYEAQILGGA